MKKIQLSIGLLMLFLTIGCNNSVDEELLPNLTLSHDIKAIAESANITRTGFNSNGKFYWSQGDQLGVTTDKAPDGFSALTLTKGAGSKSATFKGQVNGTISGYAVYPHDDAHQIINENLHFHLPQSYTYTKIEPDFFCTTDGTGNSFNAPMFSKILPGGQVKMKHLGGVLCLKIENLPQGDNLKLTLSSNKKLSGTFSFALATEVPYISTGEPAKEEEKTVNISFNNSIQQDGVFYIPVATGEYTNSRLKIFDANQRVLSNVYLGNIQINRSDIKLMTIQTSGVDTEGVYIPDNAFRAYLIENFDTDKNGALTQTEAQNVKEINIKDKKEIKSLEGIHNFTQLTTLNCSGTSISYLDVSHCPALQSLDCSMNSNLLNLNVDTLSIVNANCSHCGLTGDNYTFNNAKELVELNCSYNTITTLYLGNVNKLIYADVQMNNKLEKVVTTRTLLAIGKDAEKIGKEGKVLKDKNTSWPLQ